MAIVRPDGWRDLAVTGAAAREIETLEFLAGALPDCYTIYHAVHWTSLHKGFSVYGEIDFVVVNAAGELLLIEQKSGFLEESAEGLIKHYGGRSKRVAVQLARNVQSLQTKLTARLGGACPRLEYLLYCPDYRVRAPLTAGLEPARIVDAGRREALASVITTALPAGEPAPAAQDVHRFLRDTIQLETDVSALMGRARDLVTRISGGLAHWARRLHFEPYRLRVVGTAGSGKTQLALAEYEAALGAGRRPLYVCYNRPLADHMERVAPPGGQACTFHHLCDRLIRSQGLTPDYSLPDAFSRVVDIASRVQPPEALRFDTVIVDEGQDFSESWRDAVFRLARPGARLLWLEDPWQNLYGRPPVALPGWVEFRAAANFRSPRSVVRLLQHLLPPGLDMEAASPFEGDEVDFITYGDTDGLRQGVKDAIRRCYASGYRKEDIALLSYRGREQSSLLSLDQLGPHRLRRFTGRYDLLGHPEFSEGDVLTESIYRFKGQAAPAVVLAEVDFETLDEAAMRKLFVGATRAMMKLVLVLSERAAAQLAARIP